MSSALEGAAESCLAFLLHPHGAPCETICKEGMTGLGFVQWWQEVCAKATAKAQQCWDLGGVTTLTLGKVPREFPAMVSEYSLSGHREIEMIPKDTPASHQVCGSFLFSIQTRQEGDPKPGTGTLLWPLSCPTVRSECCSHQDRLLPSLKFLYNTW